MNHFLTECASLQLNFRSYKADNQQIIAVPIRKSHIQGREFDYVTAHKDTTIPFLSQFHDSTIVSIVRLISRRLAN